MKPMTRFAWAAAALTLASLAHAGKAEREFYAAEVEPAIKRAAGALKQSCGCDVKFDVQVSTLETTDHMRQARGFANSISEKAAGYCTDAPSKKAICQLKTVEFSRTGSSEFKFAAGKGVATTDGSSFPHWDMMTAVLDK